MPLDSFQPGAPLSIFRLTPEAALAPKPLLFDPQRDLRPSDWENMEKRFRHIESGAEDDWVPYSPRWQRLIALAANVSVLGRHMEVKDESSVPHAERMRYFEEVEEHIGTAGMRYHILSYSADLCQLGIRPSLHVDDMNELRAGLEAMRHEIPFGRTLFALAACNMNVIGEHTGMSPEDQAYIQNLIRHQRDQRKWIEVARNAAAMRVMGQESGIVKDDWTWMLSTLDEIRNPDSARHPQFAPMARNLTILGARAAVIREGRIVLGLPNDKSAVPLQPTPEILHFMTTIPHAS